jgi:hypothetical protein
MCMSRCTTDLAVSGVFYYNDIYVIGKVCCFILSFKSNTNTTCSFEFNLKGTFTPKIENDKNHRNRTTGRPKEHLLIINCIIIDYGFGV